MMDGNKSWCGISCGDCPSEMDCSYSDSVQEELEKVLPPAYTPRPAFIQEEPEGILPGAYMET